MQYLFFVFLFILSFNTYSYAFITTTDEGICSPDAEKSKECIEDANIIQPNNIQKDFNNQDKTTEKKKSIKISPVLEKFNTPEKNKVIIYFFWGDGCPHCKEEKTFFARIKDKFNLEIKDFEVWYHKENADFLKKIATAYKLKTSGVPVTFIGTHSFIGFSKNNEYDIEKAIQECSEAKCIDPGLIASGKILIENIAKTQITGETTKEVECTERSRNVDIPWLGRVDASKLSLPVITIIIAGLDSFNPCAFFVLFSLLGLLIHARSRQKILIIGGIFVFFSGFIYFLFMAAWLNLFLIMGQVQIITIIAGIIAVLIAIINIKDFFIFKKGISLTIPDSAKPGLFDKMRKLLKSSSFISIILGTTALAIAANSYELLCTAGFPMVFTRILTLNNLSNLTYYAYLLLYNIIYVIPLFLIVITFTITLGKRQLSEWQGRVLKLISGLMMLGLGLVLLFDPTILSNTLISFLILFGAFVISLILILITKKLGYK
ncbi:MAG: hypothetical protein HXY52_10210 [Nitrospirae bacterium]|nr:hypothetical protein [Nitrospirota bacterium]